jgi:hypothetical protein
MTKSIPYKHLLLMPGSRAYELFTSKDPDERAKLDKHLKEVENNYFKLVKG